ncbi:MAG: hypothetical protein FD177_1402, partial [Desulfovibrionaceae bacterium]
MYIMPRARMNINPFGGPSMKRLL